MVHQRKELECNGISLVTGILLVEQSVSKLVSLEYQGTIVYSPAILQDKTNIRKENTETQVYPRRALLGYASSTVRRHSRCWLEGTVSLEESY